ncbi:MAG: cell division protein FtsZ [Candidatus Cloacimonetes bacterium]|nr:cell division protein FtsZ [Candidatus Cloacimonadota bacterium]
MYELELDLNHDEIPFGTHIKIIGVGGAGGNAVGTMIDYGLHGLEFVVANTNIGDLKESKAQVKLQLGRELTKGLGAGANPETGRKAAEESREEIKNNLKGTDLLFIAAGMGGGTGTGATPVIAALAREMGILTIGIVSRPFRSEGKKRTINAENGITKLRENVDTLIVIPNEKLTEIYPDMTVIDAFKKADNVLYEAAKAISDIIHYSGYMNVDFADVQTIMKNRGLAMMGSGVGDGDQRAVDAAQKAMNNPLLSDIPIENAKGVLINITAGKDFKMDEFEIITNEIVKQTGEDGDIITGIIIDDELEGKIKVTLITTGLDTPNTSVYERETIIYNKENESEDIEHTLQRIRKTDSLNINKGTEDKTSTFDKQMEIPAFLRKFSN